LNDDLFKQKKHMTGWWTIYFPPN